MVSYQDVLNLAKSLLRDQIGFGFHCFRCDCKSQEPFVFSCRGTLFPKVKTSLCTLCLSICRGVRLKSTRCGAAASTTDGT